MITKNIYIFQLTKKTVFRKTIATVRNDRDIRFKTIKVRRNYLVAKSNYHTTNYHSYNLLTM